MNGAVRLRTASMTCLIVDANDFSQTQGSNCAVVELPKASLLTSATLIARVAATDQSIKIARITPTRGIERQMVLRDGKPHWREAAEPELYRASLAQRLER